MRMWLLASLLVLLAAPASMAADADAPLKDDLGRDYFVYAPAKIDPKKTYWLVVGVHGAGGNGQGAGGLAAWARRGETPDIVLFAGDREWGSGAVAVSGPLPAVTGWLTGRSRGEELTADGDLPELPRWL